MSKKDIEISYKGQLKKINFYSNLNNERYENLNDNKTDFHEKFNENEYHNFINKNSTIKTFEKSDDENVSTDAENNNNNHLIQFASSSEELSSTFFQFQNKYEFLKENNDLKQQIEELQKKYEELDNKNKELDNKNKELEKNNEELKKNNNELNNKNKELEIKNVELLNQNRLLKSKFNEKKQKKISNENLNIISDNNIEEMLNNLKNNLENEFSKFQTKLINQTISYNKTILKNNKLNINSNQNIEIINKKKENSKEQIIKINEKKKFNKENPYCNSCHNNIYEIRFKCENCKNFVLCEKCYNQNSENHICKSFKQINKKNNKDKNQNNNNQNNCNIIDNKRKTPEKQKEILNQFRITFNLKKEDYSDEKIWKYLVKHNFSFGDAFASFFN